MTNLAEKLNEYLHNWYYALPIPALNKIHQLTPNHLYQVANDDYDEELNKLRDEWYELDLVDKLELHDSMYEEFYEFTKNISFNNLIN